jgi:hypothetical protein
MKVSYATVIDKVETKSDGSLKITQTTAREMSATEMTALFSFKGKECWTLLSSNDDLTEQDIPDEKPDVETGQKSKSQRLRAVIFVLWKQNGSKGSFEDYYSRILEGLIEQIKDKLE